MLGQVALKENIVAPTSSYFSSVLITFKKLESESKKRRESQDGGEPSQPSLSACVPSGDLVPLPPRTHARVHERSSVSAHTEPTATTSNTICCANLVG
jgi:hypothetical protein